MTGAKRAAVALMVSYGFCWARPSSVCGPEGLHLARYVRAYRKGLLSQEVLAVMWEGCRRSAPVMSSRRWRLVELFRAA